MYGRLISVEVFQTLHGHRVGSQVCAFVVLEFLYQPVDDSLVEVITAQVGITVGGQYLEHTATELKDRDIECTTTKVEYGNLHIFVGLVNTVSQCSSRRLVYDTFNVQTSNLTSFLRSLTL